MTDYGHDLQFGVFVAPAAQSADHVVALLALAEEVGYDLVTFNDHPYSPGALDALTLMSFVAARTGRVRLAANVLSLPLRPPPRCWRQRGGARGRHPRDPRALGDR